MGLPESIAGKVHAMRDRRARRKEFRRALLDAVADGELREEEMRDLERRRDEMGLEEEDIAEVRLEAYLLAYEKVAADQEVSDAEWIEMEKIQRFLGIKDGEVARTKKDLLRLHILHEVRSGNLPILRVGGLGLATGEQAHWREPMRRPGPDGERRGELIVTSKRVIFRGREDSFAIRLSSILSVGGDRKTVVLAESRKDPHVFLYERDGYRPILRSILAQVLGKR